MTDRYNVEAVKSRTNYMDGRVSGPVILDSILERGNITIANANTVGYKGQTLGMKSATFAVNPDIDVVNLGDYYVQLAASDASYTYEACQGRPVVTAVSGTGGVAGTLVTFGNSLMVTPTATENTLADRVNQKNHAIEAVKFFAMEYHPVKVKVSAEANVAVGDALTYDVSSAMWVKDVDGTAVISCHVATADGEYVGALFGPHFAVSQA